MVVQTYTAPGDIQIAITGRASVRLAAVEQSFGLSALVAFDVDHHVTAGDRIWQARVVGDAFEVRDLNDRMLIAFHWRPTGRRPVTWPHLHVGTSVSSEKSWKNFIGRSVD